MPYKISGKTPPPQIYQQGTKEFLYYANASALRRTADFWGSIIPQGTSWEVGSVLPVDLDSGEDLNAFYTRGDGGDAPGLHFFHEEVSGRVYFSGESPDVACHEMGHAVLDAIRPQLFDAQTIEAAAFHESFGDMSALLSALQVDSFRQALLSDTRGKLNRSSRLSRLAEQLGAAIRIVQPDAVDPDCLRNAFNSFFYRDPQTLPPSAPASQLSSEAHSFSRVFTGAFLEIVAGIFAAQANADANGLVLSSEEAAQILVGGIMNASIVPDYFSQVAANIVQFAEGAPFNGKYRDILKSAFVRRGILSLQAASTVSNTKPQTMRIAAAAASRSKQPATLPKASISATHYGLKQSVIKVHIAAEPKTMGVTGSSLILGSLEPRSSQNAAEAYTENLFQRGHVDAGKYADENTGFHHPHTFKTHIVFEEDGELVLKRITFNCGFDHPGGLA
ncbi:MAG TPA: hypothetical protein VFE61_31395 [Candidatus Sulfotelmatobacter sp.]|nr:hypothetical protein [Candidatus Sulfotelmatobacter sp.]